MIVATLFLNILISQSFAAQPMAMANGFPRCVRPQDFSIGKFVASYEACLTRQKTFCSSHEKLKECVAVQPNSGTPYYKVAADAIDPTKRCKILKDGTYKCLQDPVKLVLPDEPKEAPTITSADSKATPSGSPVAPAMAPLGQDVAAPRSVEVPMEDEGASGTKNSPTTPARSKLPQSN